VLGYLFTPIRDFPPSVWGKLSTFMQVATAAAVLMEKTGDFEWLRVTIPLLFAVVAAAAFWSAGHYLAVGLRRAYGTGTRQD